MKPRARTITLFALGAGLLALPFLFRGMDASTPQKPIAVQEPQPQPQPEPQKPQPAKPQSARKIQVALLLDTSSSMDGLIGQAKTQLWKIVNELNAAKKDGVRPVIELALFEYGKSSLSAETGWIRRVLPLTGDLDKVSEELFALTTNGGEEYCGHAIRTATLDLEWSSKPEDLKLIFIAGNEAFTQGSVDYRDSIREAAAKGIAVNTIFCGARSEGIATGWQSGAMIADGRFLSIDQDSAVAYIAAPQDDEIQKLGLEINNTYIPYGSQGASSYARQQAQDSNAAQSAGSMMYRSNAKASGAYHNPTWDLVDASKDGSADVTRLETAQLPGNMQKMSAEERQAYVKGKSDERARIQKRIAELNVERTKFIDAEMKKQSSTNANTFDAAMIAAVRDQAAKNGFMFE